MKKKSWRPTYSMVLFVLKGKSIHKNIAFWNQMTSVKIQGETHFTAALVGEGKVDARCGSVFCFFGFGFAVLRIKPRQALECARQATSH